MTIRVIPVHYGDRRIGTIISDIYVTERWTKKHFYKKMQGYAITTEVLNNLNAMDVKRVRIREHGKNIKVYECDLIQYMRAKEFQEGDHEPQKCVRLKDMKVLNEFAQD